MEALRSHMEQQSFTFRSESLSQNSGEEVAHADSNHSPSHSGHVVGLVTSSNRERSLNAANASTSEGLPLKSDEEEEPLSDSRPAANSHGLGQGDRAGPGPRSLAQQGDAFNSRSRSRSLSPGPGSAGSGPTHSRQEGNEGAEGQKPRPLVGAAAREEAEKARIAAQERALMPPPAARPMRRNTPPPSVAAGGGMELASGDLEVRCVVSHAGLVFARGRARAWVTLSNA